MFALYLVCALSLCATSALAQFGSDCFLRKLGQYPIDQEVFYKTVYTRRPCKPDKNDFHMKVRIEPWAVLFEPFNVPATYPAAWSGRTPPAGRRS